MPSLVHMCHDSPGSLGAKGRDFANAAAAVHVQCRAGMALSANMQQHHSMTSKQFNKSYRQRKMKGWGEKCISVV